MLNVQLQDTSRVTLIAVGTQHSLSFDSREDSVISAATYLPI